MTALSVPQSDENASWSGGGYLFNAIFVLALLSFAAVGLLIAIKGRGGVISRLLLAIGLSWGVADLTAYPDAASTPGPATCWRTSRRCSRRARGCRRSGSPGRS